VAVHRPLAPALALSWRIRGRPGLMTVHFYGEIDESADFADLRHRLGPRLVFRLGEVRRIDGRGTLSWVRFMRELEGHDVAWTHCSPAIVGRLNVVSDFAGSAKVRSLLAPYLCTGCGRAEERLIDVRSELAGKTLGYAPTFACDACGKPLELDDLPERYFSFLFP
jgi:eukaryotic-like serine/threonine-protein kinase